MLETVEDPGTNDAFRIAGLISPPNSNDQPNARFILIVRICSTTAMTNVGVDSRHERAAA